MGLSFSDLIPGKGYLDYFFKQPAQQAKAGYDATTQMDQQGTQKLMDFYAKQQAQAQAAYKPLQSMFTSTYGTQGIKPPVLPGGGR